MTEERFKDMPEGERVPGGCEDCDAYQILDKSQAPVYQLFVYHDDTCPALKGMANQ